MSWGILGAKPLLGNQPPAPPAIPQFAGTDSAIAAGFTGAIFLCPATVNRCLDAKSLKECNLFPLNDY